MHNISPGFACDLFTSGIAEAASDGAMGFSSGCVNVVFKIRISLLIIPFNNDNPVCNYNIHQVTVQIRHTHSLLLYLIGHMKHFLNKCHIGFDLVDNSS